MMPYVSDYNNHFILCAPVYIPQLYLLLDIFVYLCMTILLGLGPL